MPGRAGRRKAARGASAGRCATPEVRRMPSRGRARTRGEGARVASARSFWGSPPSLPPLPPHALPPPPPSWREAAHCPPSTPRPRAPPSSARPRNALQVGELLGDLPSKGLSASGGVRQLAAPWLEVAVPPGTLVPVNRDGEPEDASERWVPGDGMPARPRARAARGARRARDCGRLTRHCTCRVCGPCTMHAYVRDAHALQHACALREAAGGLPAAGGGAPRARTMKSRAAWRGPPVPPSYRHDAWRSRLAVWACRWPPVHGDFTALLYALHPRPASSPPRHPPAGAPRPRAQAPVRAPACQAAGPHAGRPPAGLRREAGRRARRRSRRRQPRRRGCAAPVARPARAAPPGPRAPRCARAPAAPGAAARQGRPRRSAVARRRGPRGGRGAAFCGERNCWLPARALSARRGRDCAAGGCDAAPAAQRDCQRGGRGGGGGGRAYTHARCGGGAAGPGAGVVGGQPCGGALLMGALCCGGGAALS
jgi:hypothetical protein